MTDIVVPKVGLTIEEVEVTEWLVNVGDEVVAGQAIASVNADKTEVEISTEVDGTIGSLLVAVGEVVAVGGVLARLTDLSDRDAAEDTHHLNDEKLAESNQGWTVHELPEQLPVNSAVRIKSSPRARAVARLTGVDLVSLIGTGPGGRIVERDVETQARAAPDLGGVPAPSTITFKARADVAEAIGVTEVARMRGISVGTFDLLVAATFTALDRHRVLPGDRSPERVGVTRNVRGTGSRPVPRFGPATVAQGATAIREALDREGSDDGCIVTIVDMTEAALGIEIPALPTGAAIVVAMRPASWVSRVREGTPVTRPRVEITMSFDASLVRGAAAAAALRTIAVELARSGDLLAQFAHPAGAKSTF